jgi:hypothetical protein
MPILEYKTTIKYDDGTTETEQHRRPFDTMEEAKECEFSFFNGDFGGLLCYDFKIKED